MDWSADGWRSAFRIELRVQAIGLASRGWPVVPGTYPVDSRWAGRTESEVDGPQPVHTDWQDRLDTPPDQVASLWSDHPYSLLLATGAAVEAIEVRENLGHRAASALRSQGFPVPIVATPDGRWYFLTSGGGQRLCSELANTALVRLHSAGSWVPMPPTTFPHGVVHWRVRPEVCGWRLPTPDLVQDALCVGMHAHENVANLVAATR
jgi:hypothetical protein